ncbi:cytochrome-c oxidase, cbb3-type subunit III [Stakelama tenebrarum]|uniref:Cbb3-type cytochrome c oxidase subunit n=1 Tax=Stakelama tenebrarum TaxID=2711215 RepID=A0A6G6Y9C0_9SPHN|nr:cytochrome-c oxidase, cbb3-type subunit III [Sphingosinithalassobacter tenebrarum]QIG81534.1 cytochrome-c oxidase, cbb3-type subunit III [Sphingosinithalassobacter tenebrarum]
MADKKRIDEPTGTQTVGHEWDGIEELDTPMPRWWLIIFYATVVFAIVYTILYPAWPMIDRATAGVLGWTSHGQLEEQLAEDRAERAPVMAALAVTPVEKLLGKPELLETAIQGGRSAFLVNCVQCHGSGAAGSKGYPNLNDDNWLWGGDIAAIEKTLIDGIRQPGHDETRMSQMPAFGRDGLLSSDEIKDLVSYVRFVSGQEPASESAQRGRPLFENNCAVCHGADAKGDRQFGAPNLTDAIWLYGGDRNTITDTIHNSRYGIMPAWGDRLDPVTIKMLAAYVHSLGGGEASPVPEAETAPAPDESEGNVVAE